MSNQAEDIEGKARQSLQDSGYKGKPAQEQAQDTAEEPTLEQRVVVAEKKLDEAEANYGTLFEHVQRKEAKDKVAFERIWAAIESLEK